MTEKFLLIDL